MTAKTIPYKKSLMNDLSGTFSFVRYLNYFPKNGIIVIRKNAHFLCVYDLTL